MQEDLNKRINQILTSIEDSQRAKPKMDLLAKMERQIYEIEGNVIPINRIRLVAAAAAIMLLLNISALNHYLQNRGNVDLVEMDSSTSLITDFKLYD